MCHSVASDTGTSRSPRVSLSRATRSASSSRQSPAGSGTRGPSGAGSSGTRAARARPYHPLVRRMGSTALRVGVLLLRTEANNTARLTSRACRVPRRHDGQARAAPARTPRPALARGHAPSRGAQDQLDRGAPRAAASPRAWLDGRWRRHGARARARNESSHAIAAHCWPARSRAVCCPCRSPGAGRPADVAPGTRPANRQQPKGRQWWQAARRVPRLFAPGLRRSPDNGAPLS